jgi:hypothetical protein
MSTIKKRLAQVKTYDRGKELFLRTFSLGHHHDTLLVKAYQPESRLCHNCHPELVSGSVMLLSY